MDDLSIQRINELYKKMKTVGLTEEEKKEQAELRSAYISAIRADLQSSLNNISIKNEDGSITPLKKKNLH
ncbi:DUF896 domain-containing protein [Anaerosporobacter faecicola]|uniref:DUF896 domain-containing protein n=1 Tax=Anaerosporobacter faecicola TaxID=2718714 RepID=UPI00143B7055|nr:DUF896 domain-containing protein [Anaerosporobacter faecicola]